jgi:5'-3' exonuclease
MMKDGLLRNHEACIDHPRCLPFYIPTGRAQNNPLGEEKGVRRLHLLDATYELFRAHFAVPPARTPDGREVGATRGLMASIVAFLNREQVTHIAAATDHVIESFRNALFPSYKTGEGIPADLLAQFPLAEDALRALGISVWPMVDFEADDALATAAHRFAGEVDQVVVLSPDKDLAQCVRGKHVVTYDRQRDTLYDEDGVRARFGVWPRSIPDYLALVGDPADGIPGIPGWGPKSAAAVLAVYKTIDAIPHDPGRWPPNIRRRDHLAARLDAHAGEARLYRTLATLRTDVPITESLNDLAWPGVPRRHFEDFCNQYGFGDLLQRPKRWAD